MTKPNRYTVREAILTTVNTRYGVNGRDLVLNCMGMLNPQLFDDNDYAQEVIQLVVEREIEPLYFFLPYEGSFMMQTIYFPKGTRIVTQNEQEATFSNTPQSGRIQPRRVSKTRIWLDAVSRRWQNVYSRFVSRRRNRDTIGAIHTRSH